MSKKIFIYFLIVFFLLIGMVSVVAETTDTDTVTISFTEPGGLLLLGMTGVNVVSLEAYETYNEILPGEQTSVTVTEGVELGGRLHYTVHGQTGEVKITVKTVTPIVSGTLKVEVISGSWGLGEGATGTAVSGSVIIDSIPREIITQIGDCYTGIGSTDGPRVQYTLYGNPGFDYGTVDVEYIITSGQ